MARVVTPETDSNRHHRLRRLAIITAALVIPTMLLRGFLPASAVTIIVTVFSTLWLLALSLATLGWMWRTLTYRVGVRLFLSYLIIGVLPFLIMGCLGVVAVFMATGQYTSVRYGTLFDRMAEDLDGLAERAAQAPPAARAQILGGAGAGQSGLLPAVEWMLVDGPRHLASPGLADAESPGEKLLGSWTGPVIIGRRPFYATARHTDQGWLVAMMPLRAAALAAASRAGWFEVRLSDAVTAQEEPGGPLVKINVERKSPPQEAAPDSPSPANTNGSPDADPPTTSPSRGWLSRRFVVWPRVSQAPRDWTSGEATTGQRLAVVLGTSPAEAWADFMQAPYRLGNEVRAGFLGLAGFFAVLYALVLSFAVVMIVSITRSTARLTRGARAVAEGNLAYRIPVRRRDQLGDLAVAFNTMAASVDRMLKEVGEKERLKREMELAREIQQSLLPETQLRHAGLAVSAHFLPASEVGGDYFDVFPLPDGEVFCTVGDVAGHGLSTGLLMAMVKSAMGTLVLEGYRGPELLERLNRLLLQQSVKHRMATMVLVSANAATGEAEVTSCGHPPVLLVRPDGEVEEILLSSLPLGTRLPAEPATRRLAFPAGSKLLVYSDGLIEAANAAGQALGADALSAIARRHASRPAAGLVAALLAELHIHLQGQMLADDLTILVVEHGG